MVNETQKKPIEQIQLLEQFLPNEKQKDLAQILAFGEKYKADSSDAWYKFWSTYGCEEYRQLLSQYEWSKQKFLAWLTQPERKILDSMPVTVKDKFIRQYLFDWVVYSGDATSKISLRPGMKIDLGGNNIWPERAMAIAKKWKNRLQPWMIINLEMNNIWDDGVKAIAEEWRDKLQPGMYVSLARNKIWVNWAKVIAENWKNSLQPGMQIYLSRNDIWSEGAIAIAKKWKDSLQPWMTIDLNLNNIWPEGAKAITEIWEYKLQPGIAINLRYNKIWDEWAKMLKSIILKDWVKIDLRDNGISYNKKKELKDWEKSYTDRWIHCKVLVDDEE